MIVDQTRVLCPPNSYLLVFHVLVTNFVLHLTQTPDYLSGLVDHWVQLHKCMYKTHRFQISRLTIVPLNEVFDIKMYV